MASTHRIDGPQPGGDSKRTRLRNNNDQDGGEFQRGKELIEDVASASSSPELLHCSEQPEKMNPEKITEYMADLPAATQHYDLLTLWGLPVERVLGWGDYVSTWEELRGMHVNYFAMKAKAPGIQGKSRAPPISPLKLRLQAVATYENLLIKAKELEVPAEITLELAKKLLDYLVLCFARASVQHLKSKMPDYHTTFSLAVEVIKNHLATTVIPRGGHELAEINGHHPITAKPRGGAELVENNGDHPVTAIPRGGAELVENNGDHPVTAIPRGGAELVENNGDHPVTAISRGGHELAENNGHPRSLGMTVGPTSQLGTTCVSDDVDKLKIDPTTLRAYVKQWDAIAGNRESKKALYNAVVWSTKLPDVFPEVENVLLFGPPGTGKTMLVQCLTVIGAWNVFKVGQDAYKDRFQGESEKKLRRIYNRAKETSPSIVFLDGVDSLMGSRADAEQCQGATEIKNFLRDLLSEISATEAKVMTIAATNRPQVMDTAFLRRFDRCIYVPLPDEAAVFSIIQTELQGFDHDPFLDTPEGRVQLKFLARGCIEDRDGQKRWLSGHDIVRAMKSIKADKMDEIFEANYFEERTRRDGTQVLVPCPQKPNAIRRKVSELDDADLRRVNVTTVNLLEVTTALLSVRGKTTSEEIQDLDIWNENYGSRFNKQ